MGRGADGKFFTSPAYPPTLLDRISLQTGLAPIGSLKRVLGPYSCRSWEVSSILENFQTGWVLERRPLVIGIPP